MAGPEKWAIASIAPRYSQPFLFLGKLFSDPCSEKEIATIITVLFSSILRNMMKYNAILTREIAHWAMGVEKGEYALVIKRGNG